MKKKAPAILQLPVTLSAKPLYAKSIILFNLLLMVIPSVIFCQNLDDFRAAAQAQGVQSIPFSQLRSEAASIQGDINSWKQATASYQSWETYDRNKSKNYKAIRMENEIVKSRQQNISSLKSKNVDASQFEKELDFNFKNIKSYNDEIANINYEVSKAIDAWDKLSRLRSALREKFSDVLYKLSNAKSSPNQFLGSSPTDENRNKLIGYLNDIESGIKSRASGHADEEKACYNAKQNMESVLKKNSE